MEYYGKCPKCESLNIETLDSYEQPNSRGVEVRFICKCNECGNRFDIGNNDK
jgi:transcriptional regulator NrdR family protein